MARSRCVDATMLVLAESSGGRDLIPFLPRRTLGFPAYNNRRSILGNHNGAAGRVMDVSSFLNDDVASRLRVVN